MIVMPSFATNVPASERDSTYSMAFDSPWPPSTGISTFPGLISLFSCRRRSVTVLSALMFGVMRSIVPTSSFVICTVMGRGKGQSLLIQ